MSMPGVYPFTIYVANVFHPDSIRDVSIQVKHYHHPGYIYYKKESVKKGEVIGFDIHPINEDTPAEYTIKSGYRLGFPMLMGDEYIEISLYTRMDSLKTNYNIRVGAKAECYPNESLGVPEEGTYLGCGPFKNQENAQEPTFYLGGKWTVDKSNKDWKLTIKKYEVDPIEENVTIGDVEN